MNKEPSLVLEILDNYECESEIKNKAIILSLEKLEKWSQYSFEIFSKYYHLLYKENIVIGCSRGESTINHENYRHFVLDVSDEKAVVNMIRSVKKEFGKIEKENTDALIQWRNDMSLLSQKQFQKMLQYNQYDKKIFSHLSRFCFTFILHFIL